MGDANLYLNVTPMQVQGAIKKVNDRLTENLTFEYSLGYNPSGGAEHAGMKLLESLRGHQQKLALASNFVTALAAKNGPPSQPQALLAAKTALVEAGVPVSEDVQTIVVEKALKAAASAEDGYATFWKLLCPSGQLGPDDPDQGLTIDSLPENSEDHEQKAFQKTWVVHILVDLLRQDGREEQVTTFIDSCPSQNFNASTCARS